MTVSGATSPSVDVGDIEKAVTAIVTWATGNDVQQATMHRIKCTLPHGSVWLLARLAKCGPVRLSDLASALRVDNSTLSPQAHRLEREGLIVRQPDPRDGRAALLRVAPAGRKLLTRLHNARRALFAELLVGWSDADRADAAATLARLADALTSGTAEF